MHENGAYTQVSIHTLQQVHAATHPAASLGQGKAPTPILRVGQEIPELMALESLDVQLALSQQIGLVGAKFVGTKFVGRLAKIPSKIQPRPAGNCAW